MNKKIILIISILLLVIIPAAMITAQSTATGRSRGSVNYNLTITCNVPGASVSIPGGDNKDSSSTTGRTPFTIQLNKGIYRITVSAPNYLPKTMDINLQSDQSINFVLEADMPGLSVNSNVQNAVVEISSVNKSLGTIRGNTPYSAALNNGRYTVTVSAPGYVTQSQQVNLDSSTSLYFNLEAENYSLSVTSNVVNARVIIKGSSINGSLTGNTTYNTVLPPGTYQVRVNAPGYFALEKTVQLNRTQNIDFMLQPQTARLSVIIPNNILNYTVSNPASQIIVYDNGKEVDMNNIQLSPGQHTIRIVSGAFAAQQTINVRAGETYSFELNFGVSVIKN